MKSGIGYGFHENEAGEQQETETTFQSWFGAGGARVPPPSNV